MSHPKSLQTFLKSSPFLIFIDENENNWKMPFEWHNYLEIFYVLDGVGRYLIEDKRYTFEKGDLFVICNHELHKSQLINGQSFKAMIVMFDQSFVSPSSQNNEKDLLQIFFDRPANFSHQLSIRENMHEDLMFIYNKMMREYQSNDGCTELGLSLLLQYLLLELNRAFDQQLMKHPVEDFKGFKLREVTENMLDLIDTRFKEELNLNQVSKELNMTPNYLSREFKKATGFTFIEFLTSKRIRYARDLLRGTEMSVTEIAFEVGYNNVTHFHWTFKKLIGVSPGKYRSISKVYER